MAYLKHLKVFTGILLVTALITSVNYPLAQADQESLRQASKTTAASQKQFRQSPALITKYAKNLETLGVYLRPGTDHREDSKPTRETSLRCKSLVYQTLMKLPENHRNQLAELTLYYTKDGRRGLGGSGSIVLRCLNVTDEELVSVLTHEIGHLVDSGYLVGLDTSDWSGFYDFDTPVPSSDNSSLFYEICWDSETGRKTEAGRLDFVSGYSMTDPFEDFAETYAYYRLHGPEFRKLASVDTALSKKYEFMKSYVFDSQEFGASEEKTKINTLKRNYDVTILPFSLKDFLG